jgi:hypothetical protein
MKRGRRTSKLRGGQPPACSEHAKYSAYAKNGTAVETNSAPGGPMNS